MTLRRSVRSLVRRPRIVYPRKEYRLRLFRFDRDHGTRQGKIGHADKLSRSEEPRGSHKGHQIHPLKATFESLKRRFCGFLGMHFGY